MRICAVIGGILFSISFFLSLLWLAGALFKNVGITCFNVFGLLFFIVFPVLCFGMERMILELAPHAWGVMIIFIVLNLYFLFLQYMLFEGSMVLGRKYIYRIGHAFIVRKYSIDEIKKCSGSNSSGVVSSRFGRRKVITFVIQVHFTDGTQGEFSVNHKDSPKARYFLETIKANRKKQGKSSTVSNGEPSN